MDGVRAQAVVQQLPVADPEAQQDAVNLLLGGRLPPGGGRERDTMSAASEPRKNSTTNQPIANLTHFSLSNRVECEQKIGLINNLNDSYYFTGAETRLKCD